MELGQCTTANTFNASISVYYPVSSTVSCAPSVLSGYVIMSLEIVVFVLAFFFAMKFYQK